MSRDTRNDFAIAMQRLRSDRYISRQYGDDLRTIEAAHERTCKDYLQVASLVDNELPGMWSRSDLMGGATDASE